MVKSGGYTLENLYEPSPDNFNPVDNYLGKSNLISAGRMGMTVDPRTANQLAQLSTALNVGTRNIEFGNLSMQTFDQIPKQHFSEMRRKAKLAGAELTLHAPIQDMDPSGFGERGWDESKQKLVERQLKDVIDKAAIINPNGNMPVTIHGSNAAGSTFKMIEGKKQYEQLVAVDRESGQLIPVKEETKYYPGGEKGEVLVKSYSSEKQLEVLNGTKWDDILTKAEFQRENAERIMSGVHSMFKEKYAQIASGKEHEFQNNEEYNEIKKVFSAASYIQEAEKEARAAFSKAYKLAEEDKDKEQIDYLNNLSKTYAKNLGQNEKTGKPTINQLNPQVQSEAIFGLVQGLKRIQPKLFNTIEEFSKEKASETFANVAMHSYKKYGEGAPIVSIENLYQGMGFSQGSDLKELVEKSQETFVKKAIKDGMTQFQAEKIAKKLIGVTFDVGHLNISKGHGFTDKDLVKEAEEIKKHLKHVHMTDNFGHSDSHLPIGMGNVPIQALLEALGDEGERAKKINEVGGWFEHFKTNPFKELLGGAGSKIYTTGDGPNWAYTGGFQQSYIEGYGQMLPDIHYKTFGAGFSQLPQSLGGQISQSGGRMGGGF